MYCSLHQSQRSGIWRRTTARVTLLALTLALAQLGGGVLRPPAAYAAPMHFPATLSAVPSGMSPAHVLTRGLGSGSGSVHVFRDAGQRLTARNAVAASGYPPSPNCGGGPCTPPLGWRNGRVMHHPRVYLVFWGPKWQTDNSNSNGVVQTATRVFSNLAGGVYNNILTQYTDNPSDPTAYIHNDTVLAGTWIDPANPGTNVGLSAILTEVGHAFQQQSSWTNTSDTQVLVYPQQGTSLNANDFGSGVCGRHTSGTIRTTLYYYSGIPYYINNQGVQFCSAAGVGVADAMTVGATHEYAETVTDPDAGRGNSTPPGWNTTDNPANEIGDLCQGYGGTSYFTQDASGNSVTLRVSYLWDNSDTDPIEGTSTGGCVVKKPASQEYWSAATGKHTVQAPILAEYVSLITTLGSPTAEQSPIAGSWVQTFQGTTCAAPAGTGSAIYASDSTTAFAVQGCIYQKYLSIGGPTSALGFPISDQYGISIGLESDFQHGHITYNSSNGVTTVVVNPAPGSNCRSNNGPANGPANCNGSDPYTTGCYDSQSYDWQVNVTNNVTGVTAGVVQLWWSPTCQTNWTVVLATATTPPAQYVHSITAFLNTTSGSPIQTNTCGDSCTGIYTTQNWEGTTDVQGCGRIVDTSNNVYVGCHTQGQASGCSGTGCNNTDPYTTGCHDSQSYDWPVTVYDGTGGTVGTVELWWSPTCQTNWVVGINNLAPSFTHSLNLYMYDQTAGNALVVQRLCGAGCTNAYTLQFYEPYDNMEAVAKITDTQGDTYCGYYQQQGGSSPC